MFLSPEEEITQKTYNALAEKFNQQWNDTDFWLDEFTHFYALCPPSSGMILDAGCGTGRDATLFEVYGYSYLGMDLSPALLKIAKERHPKTDFVRMNLYMLGFPIRSFGGFWAAASLLHIPKSNINFVLSELGHILAPEGIGFIALREGRGERMRTKDSSDIRFFADYERDEFSTIAENAGFEVLDIRKRRDNRTSWLCFYLRRPSETK